MRLILHSRRDAKCVSTMAQLLDAVGKGYARLLINETTPRGVSAPWLQTSPDWTMMGMLVNRERTES